MSTNTISVSYIVSMNQDIVFGNGHGSIFAELNSSMSASFRLGVKLYYVTVEKSIGLGGKKASQFPMIVYKMEKFVSWSADSILVLSL